MTSELGPPRRYSDEEVRHLLERAADLETEAPSLPATVDGPTLGELESIASEAGIDPALVRRAARELDSSSSGTDLVAPRSSAFLGAPAVFALDRTVRGEVDPSVLERLVPLIRRTADGVGHHSLFGKELSWQSKGPSKLRALDVSVSVGRGETWLRIEERYEDLAWSLFGGIIGGVGGGMGLGVGLGVGLGALGSAAFAVLFPLGAIGGAWALARGIYRIPVRQRMRALTKLMDEMVATLEDEADEAS
jgi:hypothetical protein